MKSNEDIYQLGMFETSEDYIKIIEWPELIKLKPKDRIDIFFEYTKFSDFRKVKVKGFGKWSYCKFDEI